MARLCEWSFITSQLVKIEVDTGIVFLKYDVQIITEKKPKAKTMTFMDKIDSFH